MSVPAHVAGILTTPVKALRIVARDAISLDPGGVRDNRRFFLIDEHGTMVNGKRYGALQAVVADYDDAARTLTLRFPGAEPVSGRVENGAPVAAGFFASTLAASEVVGPWAAALSEFVGEPLRLVEPDVPEGAIDRGAIGPVSLVSSATLELLGREAGLDAPLDARRLRMLFEIAGVGAHEEDAWIGRRLRIGGATVMARGHVGRCVITKRDPDTGEVDIDTLGALARYRRDVDTTEPVACGTFGVVVEPGEVRVGDAVELLG